MAKTKTGEPITVVQGEVRRFRCLRSCFWNNTYWTGMDEVREHNGVGHASEITFEGPTTIPANFQFENWEEH